MDIRELAKVEIIMITKEEMEARRKKEEERKLLSLARTEEDYIRLHRGEVDEAMDRLNNVNAKYFAPFDKFEKVAREVLEKRKEIEDKQLRVARAHFMVGDPDWEKYLDADYYKKKKDDRKDPIKKSEKYPKFSIAEREETDDGVEEVGEGISEMDDMEILEDIIDLTQEKERLLRKIEKYDPSDKSDCEKIAKKRKQILRIEARLKEYRDMGFIIPGEERPTFWQRVRSGFRRVIGRIGEFISDNWEALVGAIGTLSMVITGFIGLGARKAESAA